LFVALYSFSYPVFIFPFSSLHLPYEIAEVKYFIFTIHLKPAKMSRNTDANRKLHKKKIDNKKRKIQNAEAERKARLKQIREDFKAREDNNIV
jgi:hypothetical protein